MALPRTVGILGGMGPAATVLLMQRIIASVAAEDDQSHIPLIVDDNTQVPSRVSALVHGTGEDPGPILARMARRLQRAGAEALAMPCNTAHHFAPLIRSSADIPLLDMVALSAAAACEQTSSGAKIGILGSPALRRIALFDPVLAARGHEAVYPTEEPLLLTAMQSIKSVGPSRAAAGMLDCAARGLLAQGADLCLVACTEFSMLIEDMDGQLPLVDTLDVLVDAIHDFAFSEQRLNQSGLSRSDSSGSVSRSGQSGIGQVTMDKAS